MPNKAEYLFDEIHVLGEGLLASGKAILEGDAAYPGEFFVSEIRLDKGPIIRRSVLSMPPSLERFVFQDVARQIENSREAQSEWDDAVEGSSQPDFDLARVESRELQMEGVL